MSLHLLLLHVRSLRLCIARVCSSFLTVDGFLNGFHAFLLVRICFFFPYLLHAAVDGWFVCSYVCSQGEPAAAAACCFPCSSEPAAAPSASSWVGVQRKEGGEEGEEELLVSEEALARLSSKQLNSLIENRLQDELRKAPSVSRQERLSVEEGIVSFSSFLTVKTPDLDMKNLGKPQPLTAFLPPSPLFTFDGKLGLDCKAFKINFFDAAANIVPPFFLKQGETLSKQQQQVLDSGVSNATEIDLFGPDAIHSLRQDLNAARKDLLAA